MNKPSKKAKVKEPLSTLHGKVAAAKGKNPPPPQEEVGLFGPSRPSISCLFCMMEYCAAHCVTQYHKQVLFFLSCSFLGVAALKMIDSPLFMPVSSSFGVALMFASFF